MDFLTLTIGKQKNIALIAHDSKKHEMIEWCEANKEILKGHFLCGTGTTARMITEATGLPVKGYNSEKCDRRGSKDRRDCKNIFQTSSGDDRAQSQRDRESP